MNWYSALGCGANDRTQSDLPVAGSTFTIAGLRSRLSRHTASVMGRWRSGNL